MAYEAHVTRARLFFTGEDKGYAFIVYAPGSTNADIADDTATRQDISGWALSWMVKRHKTDPDASAMIAKTIGDGVVITDGPTGACLVTVTDDDLSVLNGERQYHHELKRVDPGYRTVLSFGVYVLNQAVHGDVSS